MEYSFVDYEGRFFFDAEARTVVNPASCAVKYLSKNEAALLECLLSGVQSKEKLMRQIWFDRGVVVTDASYYQLATQLRKSFEEVGLPKRGIKTIPRYGLVLAVKPIVAVTSAPGVSDAAGALARSPVQSIDREGEREQAATPPDARERPNGRLSIFGWLRSGRHPSIRSRARHLMGSMLSWAGL